MSPRLARRLVLAAAVLLSGLVVLGESRTHIPHNRGAFLALGLLVAWSFMTAGVIAWTRRPHNRIGPLMCATGLSWLSAGLTDWPNDLLFTIGTVLGTLWIGLLVHLILAYPSGRLETRPARWATIAVYLDTVVTELAIVPFTEPRLDGNDSESAHNLLLVSHKPDLVANAQGVSLAIGIVLIVAILAILVARYRGATAAARRVLTPVYVTGAVCVVTIGAVATLTTITTGADSQAPFYLFALTLAAVPQGFLYGILRTQIGRSTAVSGLIAEVESSEEPDRLQLALRRALGDPTLELVYWLPDTGKFVDMEGDPASPPTGPDRASTTIARSGRRVLQMQHDVSLLDDRGLIEAATSAAALALRNQTLAGELRAQLREVAASERRLSELLENVRMIAVSLDLDGRITYANPFLCELTGWSSDELIGQDWLEVFNGTESRYLERMASDDVLPYEENWIRTRTGEILDIAWNNTVLRDRDGRVIGATSIGEDITLRRRAERRVGFQLTVARALAGAERLEDVAEPLVEALGTTFGSWACVYWRLAGDWLEPVAVWSQPDAVPLRYGETVMGTRQGLEEGLAGYVARTEAPYWDTDLDDDAVVAANPGRLGCGSYAFPIIAGGAVDAVVQLASNDLVPPDKDMRTLLEAAADRIGQLIERRRAEQAVVDSEARKSAILSSALDCIVTIDADDVIVEFNPAAERTFGYTADEAIGRDMSVLLIPERLRDEHREGLRRHLETGGGRLMGELTELTGIRANGEEFPIELAVTRIAGGSSPLFTAFIRDITERKAAEEELRSSRARIVRAGDDARRRLERNLHDGAQQRLVSLSLSLRLARAQFQRDPDSADATLAAAGEELSQALEELRELARGIHPAILTDRGLQPALEALAGRSLVPVELRELPQAPLPPEVEAAAYYVVAESLTNVAKYADAKHATVRIVHQNGSAIIEVWDDGVGGADVSAGSGLRGLADRVEALDGRFAVYSPAGAGTRIEAVIPCGS